jgi:hypothetical protein
LKKSILAVGAERLKHPARFRPDRAQRATLQKHRSESEKTISAFFSKAGLDLKKFRALQEKRSAELERMVAKHKADALKVAAARKATLYSSIAAQSKALSRLTVVGGFQLYPIFTLDTPFLIWSNPLIDMSSAAVPFGSWAKFNFSMSASQSGSQTVGFYFYWGNPYNDDYAVINVATSMSATGYLRAHAPGGLWTSANEVDAYADLILSFTGSDATLTYGSEVAFLGSIGAYGDLFGGETEGISVSSGVNLSTTLFAIPPSTVAVFEVTLVVDYANRGGDIEADFESGDFQIVCPDVMVWLLNPPAR